MARPLRIEFPGAIYHVTSRGNAQAALFLDDIDRKSCLSVLNLAPRWFNLICHAYCLMTNHFHLLFETPDANLSKAMRQFNSVDTQAFNRRHGRVGHVLQGRLKSIVLDREAYLLELCRYIVLNPVRAAMVKAQVRMSGPSYRVTAGLDRKPEFLAVDWILEQFGTDCPQARKKYRRFVMAGLELESPWKNLNGQCLIGNEAFLGKLSPLLKDKNVFQEIPRVQRFADRPPLEEVVPITGSRADRNAAIPRACQEFGYAQTQIATATGLHNSTVNKITRKME